MSDPASPDPDGPDSGGLWSKLLALPPACSIVASLSVVWTLGPVGDWLLTYWLPVTRWFWEATLGRILWFTLTPEQKDILTLTALLFPLYWVSRYKPVTPGVRMIRLRWLALILAIAIMGLMASSLLRDAGTFLGGGFWTLWQIVLGYLSFAYGAVLSVAGLLMFLFAVFMPFGAYSMLERSRAPTAIKGSSPETAPGPSKTQRAIYSIGVFLLLCLSVSHLIARFLDISQKGFFSSILMRDAGFAVFSPRHPLFSLLILAALVLVAKSPAHQTAGRRRRRARAQRQNRPTGTPTVDRKQTKQKDTLFAIFLGLVFIGGGYNSIGLPKTLLLLFFAVMIGVIAIRNPNRMIQLGWTVVFLLACALGVALFDYGLGLVEAASAAAPTPPPPPD